MTVKGVVQWLQARLGPINRLPSWANELLAGPPLVGLLWRVLGRWGVPVALVLNEVYEHWLDPWGYNPQDVVERVRGIVLAACVVAAIDQWREHRRRLV